MAWSISSQTWILAVITAFTIMNFTTTSTIIQIQGFEISQVYEQECIRPHPVVARNVDFAWMHSVPIWYIPLQSKLNFYRLAETLLQSRASNFTLNGLLTQEKMDSGGACLNFKWDTPPVLSGFGDKVVGYTITNVMENSYGFNTRWEGDTRGRHYFTLRDNKTFVFFTTCWGDGQASWSVISTTPDLEEEIKTEILEHAKSLGFQEDYLLQQSYEGCRKLGGGGNLEKNEL